MTHNRLPANIPSTAMEQVKNCKFSEAAEINQLPPRSSPYWHKLLQCRHLGIHRPDGRLCNWTARLLTSDKRYIQRCLGPALDTGRGRPLSYFEAVELAFEWFASPECSKLGNDVRQVGKTFRISVSPIGDVYTVGHALKDYTEWTKISRSAGGHYNNLVLIVRRQGFWNHELLKLRDSLAHLVGVIMQRVGCDASAALRASLV